MRQLLIIGALGFSLGGCGPSSEEVFQEDIQASWNALSSIYGSSGKQAAELQDLHTEITDDIESRVRREVAKGESKLALLQANYSSNMSLYNVGGGAGLMAQFAEEDRMRDAKKRILQIQIDGQIEKLAVNNARIEMLKFQSAISPACAGTSVPTAAKRSQLANCSVEFNKIANSQMAFLTKVESVGIKGPRTTDLKEQIQKLAAAEQLAVRRYNNLITNYVKTSNDTSFNLPLKLTTLVIESKSRGQERSVPAERIGAPLQSAWKCNGWYTDVEFSEESGDGSGLEILIEKGKLVKLNSWEGAVFEGSPTNLSNDEKQIKANIDFAESPEQESAPISFACANGDLRVTSTSWDSDLLRKGRAQATD